MRLQAHWHNKNFPDARSMILAALGIDGDKIPRERAVYIGENGPIIHTRTGGGNRESYDTAEDFIEGSYGLDELIHNATKALTDYEDYRWQIPVLTESDFDDYTEWWKVPYEAQYRFPESDEEWAEKEADIKESIEGLEKQKAEVLATNAYTNDYLRNEYYLSDEDDEFDCTYADFFYKYPEGLKEKLAEAGYLKEPSHE